MRRPPPTAVRIGVISDTHGLMRPRALEALAGSDLLIHAGDIGSPEILPALSAIAPVRAVRGNVDREPWARVFPETETVTVGELVLWVLHDRNALDLDPAAAGFAAVISGHSHRPSLEKKDGVLYLNPGSAGPRRFKLPVSVARMEIRGSTIEARVVRLEI